MSAASPRPRTAHRVAVIPGDHVGKEVVPAALEVLEALAPYLTRPLEYETLPWGADYFLEHGTVMAEDGLEKLRGFDAILLGAIGDATRVPDATMSWGLVQKVRKSFDLWVNVRPARLRPGVHSPVTAAKAFDVIVLRENTEGEYSGLGGRLHQGRSSEVATQVSVFTRGAIERLVRYGFDVARARPQKHLTSVTKSNAMNHTMVLWDEVVEEVATDYPDVRWDKAHVDAMVMHLVVRPDVFDVIIASNLFGDIVSDLAAAVQGSIGLAAGANLNPGADVPGMFEPIHGSAPDIAGRGVANPVAAILATAMMLDNLGENAASTAIDAAVDTVLSGGAGLTPDLGGSGTTTGMTHAVTDLLRRGVS